MNGEIRDVFLVRWIAKDGETQTQVKATIKEAESLKKYLEEEVGIKAVEIREVMAM